MGSVILVVAPLTQCPQVLWITVLRLMVKVCYRQYDLHFLALSVPSQHMVGNTAELAVVPSPLQYGGTYLLPVLRITCLVLRSYWHILLLSKWLKGWQGDALPSRDTQPSCVKILISVNAAQMAHTHMAIQAVTLISIILLNWFNNHFNTLYVHLVKLVS